MVRKQILFLFVSAILVLAAASPINAAVPQSTPTTIPSRGVIVASSNQAAFYVVYPFRGNEPNSAPAAYVYGPFLSGELGTNETSPGVLNENLFDVEVTPDGRTALFSNFPESTVYFVDITQPLTPQIKGHTKISFFAEDMAVTADGRYVLVSDGGFAPKIASIDIQSMNIVEEFALPVDNSIPETPVNRTAAAIAVASNGTVIAMDYSEGKIYTLLIDNTGHLSFANSYQYFIKTDGTVSETKDSVDFKKIHPVNVALAPDEQTLLILDVSYYTETNINPKLFEVGVYRLTAPGVLEFKGAVTNLTRATQSAAFDASGEKAYLLGNNGVAFPAVGDMNLNSFQTSGVAVDNENDKIVLLKITAPGVVTLDQAIFADLGRQSSSQLFGVDALATQGDTIVAGHSTFSLSTGSEHHLSIIDGVSQKAQYITGLGEVAGVKTIPLVKLFLPAIIQE